MVLKSSSWIRICSTPLFKHLRSKKEWYSYGYGSAVAVAIHIFLTLPRHGAIYGTAFCTYATDIRLNTKDNSTMHTVTYVKIYRS